MYKCDICGQSTKPREKLEKVVMEHRKKVYGRKYNQSTKRLEEQVGSEIVKEFNVCSNCKENILWVK